MFSLTLLDHLRLTFSQVIQRHNAHTRAAQTSAQWNRRLRGTEALLMGGVSIAAAAAALERGPILSIVAASLAGAALLVLLVHLTFDFEGAAQAHAACSAALGAIRERYRSLLSDLHDGVLDASEARHRRDKLMDELRDIYDKIPAAAQLDGSRQSGRAAAAGDAADLADEEVDLFLPKSLSRSEQQPAG